MGGEIGLDGSTYALHSVPTSRSRGASAVNVQVWRLADFGWKGGSRYFYKIIRRREEKWVSGYEYLLEGHDGLW